VSTYYLSSLVAAVYCFSIATFILIRSRKPENLSFAVLAYSIAIWTSFPWAIQSAPPQAQITLGRLLYVGACLVPPLFLAFVRITLRQPLKSYPFILAGVSALVFMAVLPSPVLLRGVRILNGVTIPVPGPVYILFVLFFGVICGHAFVLLMRSYESSGPQEKNRLRYIFIAFIFAYLSGFLHFVAVYAGKEPFPHDVLIVIFASVLAYAILYHQLMDVRLVIRLTTLHLTTAALLAAACMLVCLPLVSYSPYMALTAGIGGMAFMMAFAYEPLRRALQPAIDRIVFSDQFAYLEELSQLPNDMLEFTNLREMQKFLVTRLTEAARLERVRVLMYDPGHQSYVETIFHSADASQNDLEPQRPCDLSEKSALVDLLHSNRHILLETDLMNIPQALPELKSLGGVACFPVMKERDMLGLVVLGPKRSGEPFNQQDLKILQALRMRLENFLGQAMTITQEALNMVKDSHDMKNDVNALKGRVTWRAMRIAGWKQEFEKQILAMEKGAGASSPEMRVALEALKTQAFEWFGEADRSRSIEDQSLQRLSHRLKNWAEYGRVVSEGFRGSRNMEAIEATEAARLSVERWRPHAEKKGLQIALEVDQALYVWGERSLVEQVIENLIDNAIKATQAGRVEVRCHADREGVLIEVKDTGCGIPEEHLSTIFEKPFYQGKGRETLEQSTGVGLYLVSQYARSLGGRVRAESRVGQGSSFFVHLPRYNQTGKGVAA
jgi:signal transduction histidine kinase